ALGINAGPDHHHMLQAKFRNRVKNLRPRAVIFCVPMQTTAAPWNQAPQLTADVVQISILVADRRGQHVDPASLHIKVDRLINPRAGTHSPNAKATGRKRHLGYPHRLIADVNSPVRLELSPAPTGDWEVEAGPPAAWREPASAP